MRVPLLFLVLSGTWTIAPSLQAFPELVARYILGRPVTTEALESQLGFLDALIDPLIGSSGAIAVSEFDVGDPEVKLSVLVVEPRHYGIRVTEKIDLKAMSYSVELNSKGGPLGAESGNPKPTLEQTAKAFQEQARKGSQVSSTDRPRTLFLLNGYGVPKKMGLPLALLLAEHGIRTVMPDLRGQGDSGGSGVTWGKEEPGDLSDLLKALQTKGIVEEGRVAVLGISYGAAMACLWAAQDESVETALLLAPYPRADTKIVAAYDQFLGGTKLPFQPTEELLRDGTRIAAERLEVDWESISPAAAIKAIRSPVLIMASSGDEVMLQSEVEELHRHAPKGSKLHVFEKLPHLLLGLNFKEMESLVADWLDQVDG